MSESVCILRDLLKKSIFNQGKAAILRKLEKSEEVQVAYSTVTM